MIIILSDKRITVCRGLFATSRSDACRINGNLLCLGSITGEEND